MTVCSHRQLPRPTRSRLYWPARCVAVLMAFACLSDALFLPLFGAQAQAVRDMNVDLGFADRYTPVLRVLSLGAMIALACTVARIVAWRDAYAGSLTLPIALASPVVFRVLLLVPQASSAASPVILHLGWLLSAALAGFLLVRAFRLNRVARAVLASLGISLVLAATLNNTVWLSTLRYMTRPLVMLRRLVPQARVVLLNTPSAITLPSAMPWLTAEEQPVLTGALGDTVTVAQVLDGDVGSPGGVNSFRAIYGPEVIRVYRNDAIDLITKQDAVILGYPNDTRFEAMLAGGMQASSGIGLLAQFSDATGKVLLHNAQACRFDEQHIRLMLDFTVTEGQPVTAKFFRQALAGDAETGKSDRSLFGGFLELYHVAGRHAFDYALIKAKTATQVRLGVYDWKTGQRWLAMRSDGAQWAENAVLVPVEGGCVQP